MYLFCRDRAAPPENLPVKGNGPTASSQHSWLTEDREVLFGAPEEAWAEETIRNDVPLVMGSPAHAAASRCAGENLFDFLSSP